MWQECAEGLAQDHTRGPFAPCYCKQVTVENLECVGLLCQLAGSLSYPQACWHEVRGGLGKVLENEKVVALHDQSWEVGFSSLET